MASRALASPPSPTSYLRPLQPPPSLPCPHARSPSLDVYPPLSPGRSPRQVYVLLYVLLAARHTQHARYFWPILVRWTAFATLLMSAFLVLAPPEDDEPSFMQTLIGLNGPSASPSQMAALGWVELGPSMLLFTCLVLQDAVYRSPPYRHALARHNWALVRSRSTAEQPEASPPHAHTPGSQARGSCSGPQLARSDSLWLMMAHDGGSLWLIMVHHGS